ncbi:hypothetical protein DFH07DRAFT_152822 [Mycena maculata]|uniref:Uncharacterized protein n=1 Tax=Mycena maculata TaxID=230809 RepID=A0AAD7I0B1_9AGAR|nr:hypothetical protein DFH07DRAFT_152822 [Mycena maculata]
MSLPQMSESLVLTVNVIALATQMHDAATLQTLKKARIIIEDTKQLLISIGANENQELSVEFECLAGRLSTLDVLAKAGGTPGSLAGRFPYSRSFLEGKRNLKEHRKLFADVIEFRNKVTDYGLTRVDPFTLKYEEAFPTANGDVSMIENASFVAIPSAPPPAPPLYDQFAAVNLVFGPLVWGEDIEGQVRALFDMMPQPYTGNRNITARTMETPHMVLVQFPSADDALAFQNGWNSEPAEGYECVKALLSPDYTPQSELADESWSA